MAMSQGFMKFTQALAKIREYQTDFPASAMQCLIAVMVEEGLTQIQVGDRTGLPRSTCSRCMRLLSPRLSPGKEGMGLIDFRHDDTDARFKYAHLTPKGEALKAVLGEILN